MPHFWVGSLGLATALLCVLLFIGAPACRTGAPHSGPSPRACGCGYQWLGPHPPGFMDTGPLLSTCTDAWAPSVFLFELSKSDEFSSSLAHFHSGQFSANSFRKVHFILK